MICLKLATRTGSFQVDVDATPPDCGVANINYERKPLAVPGTWNTGTNYADSRYQLPRIDTKYTVSRPANKYCASQHAQVALRPLRHPETGNEIRIIVNKSNGNVITVTKVKK